MNTFTIVEGSLKITYNNVVILLIAKKDLAIIANDLYKTVPRAVLYNLQRGYNETLFNMPLTTCSVDGITPFTQSEFIDWSAQNLGF